MLEQVFQVLVRAVAHLLPSQASGEDDETASCECVPTYRFLDPRPASLLDVDFLELIESLESEMARALVPVVHGGWL